MPVSAYAAPCCGAGSAAPTIITGDDLAQLSASISQAQVIGDAPASGLPVFRAEGDIERTQTFRLDGALLLSEHWQVGASLPITRRIRQTPRLQASESGLGDLSLSGAYEILPEWEYSIWQPRGFVFSQILVPTGGSIYKASYSSSQPWGLDARGRGFAALSVGALFVKGWSNWDATALLELHHSFSRSFSGQGEFTEDLRLTPGWGGSAAVSAGYSPNALPLRFGLALSPTYEGSVQAEGAVTSTSNPQLVWNTTAQLAWMINSSSGLSALYTDQTLLGPVTNVSLNRTVALTFQKRWER